MTQKTNNAAGVLWGRRGAFNTPWKTQALAAVIGFGAGIGRSILLVERRKAEWNGGHRTISDCGYNRTISINTAHNKSKNLYSRDAGVRPNHIRMGG